MRVQLATLFAIVTMVVTARAEEFGQRTTPAPKPLQVVDLRCEYQVNPLGIDVQHPRLNWRLKSDLRGQQQLAYRILVASSIELLESGEVDLWDSGRIQSSRTIHVSYEGRSLGSAATMLLEGRGVACPWWRCGGPERDGLVGNGDYRSGPMAGGSGSTTGERFRTTTPSISK